MCNQPGYLFSNGTDTNGTTYFFQISAVNDGIEGPLSDEVSATPQIPPPGQAPQNAQIVANSGQVTLSWTPVAQASGYVIYWATEPGIPPAASNRLAAIQSPFVHDGLDNGQSYFYRVVAVNAGGEGALSELLAAQPQIPPPATPTSFDVQPGDGQVVITFDLAPTATDYRVYWHQDSAIPLAQWSSRTVQPGDILTGLSNDQTAFYRLQALNAGGSSPLTDPVSATPQPNPPAAPTGLTAASGSNELNVTWNTQPGLSYTLYWSDDPQIAPRDSNIISDVRPTYRHTGLNNNIAYRYQISASNSGGESALSAAIQATPSGAVPAQPQGLQGGAGEGSNTLSWQAVANAELYTVQWSIQADMSNPQSAVVNAPLFVHAEPPASTLYYRVIANNSNGDSLPSAIIEIAQNNANQAPQITQGVSVSVTMDEDSTPTAFALNLDATDNDGDTLTWTIQTPANRGSAQITGNNTTAAIAYTPQTNANGSDVFTVLVSDGQGGTDSIQINVNITPQNDAPVITNTATSLSVSENTTAITAITVTDIDIDSRVIYALSGIDRNYFQIAGSALTFINARDFENPQDSGGDNTYNVILTVSDSINFSAPVAFAITVTDVNDAVPVITTPPSLSVSENTSTVVTLSATDMPTAAASATA
ncbi:MAG: hypothetical protein GXP17_03410 [Gammaproteobacteria bacterium]|nr:hypothetical protein [Gammaproteobacteria bacterium]